MMVSAAVIEGFWIIVNESMLVNGSTDCEYTLGSDISALRGYLADYGSTRECRISTVNGYTATIVSCVGVIRRSVTTFVSGTASFCREGGCTGVWVV